MNDILDHLKQTLDQLLNPSLDSLVGTSKTNGTLRPCNATETLSKEYGVFKTSFKYESLSVFSIVNRGSRYWRGKAGYELYTSSINFPYMQWHDYDRLPEYTHNANMNWAPRGCYVVESAFKGIPPQFVHVNWDVKLPWFVRNEALLLIVLLIAVAIGVHAGIRDHSSVAGLVVFGLSIGGFAALCGLLKFVVNLRDFFLINFFVRRLIYRYKIEPNIENAPWHELKGFRIFDSKRDEYRYEDPVGPNIPNTIPNKTQIRADFGVGYPEMTVTNGTWPEGTITELHRLLVLHFIERRAYHLEQHCQYKQEIEIRVQISHKANKDNQKAFELLAALDDRSLDQPLPRAKELLIAASLLLIDTHCKWTPSDGYERIPISELKIEMPDEKRERIASAQKPIAEAAAILNDPATPSNDALRGILALVEQTWRDRDLVANFSEERYAAHRTQAAC